MISIVICTYNRCESLAQTLDSLAKLVSPAGLEWELLVVDNNCTDHTKAVVENFCHADGKRAVYVIEEKQGLSHARNRGVAEARGSIIAFVDDDVLIEEQWMRAIHETFGRFACIAVGGRVLASWGGEKPAWYEEQGPYAISKPIVHFDQGEKPREIETYPFGANMAFRREAFSKFGLFRTDLGRSKNVLAGGEDFEFFKRLMNAGQIIAYAPGAVVHHPVCAERKEKKYFRRWYFNAARSQVRLDGIPNQIVCYCGVPRYLLRLLTKHFIKWLSTMHSKRRFYFWLQLCSTVGSMVESRHWQLANRRPER